MNPSSSKSRSAGSSKSNTSSSSSGLALGKQENRNVLSYSNERGKLQFGLKETSYNSLIFVDEKERADKSATLTPLPKNNDGKGKRADQRCALGELSSSLYKSSRKGSSSALATQVKEQPELSSLKKTESFKLFVDDTVDEDELLPTPEVARRAVQNVDDFIGTESIEFAAGDFDIVEEVDSDEYPEPEHMTLPPSNDVLDYFNSEPPSTKEYKNSDDDLDFMKPIQIHIQFTPPEPIFLIAEEH